MRGSLGEKIGEGATADVHAWAPGQVVKLFKAGVSRQFGSHEARMTRAVFAAGASAPEVFDAVTLEGRFGIVLQRLDGPTLVQLLRTRAMTFAQAAATLASLYISIQKTPPPPDLPSLRDWFDYVSRIPGAVPKHIATGILSLIERLPPGDGPGDGPGDVLCHGDLHPENVIMTADGPNSSTGSVRSARPPPTTLGAVTSCFASSSRKAWIRSGLARSMRRFSPNTRGWPAWRPLR
jgi:hypothetical protein